MLSLIPAVATDHVQQLTEALPGLLAGYYLHGSVTLGAFDPAQSDVDFLALVSRPPSADDMTRLRAVHARVLSAHRRPGLDGVYVTAEVLGGAEEQTSYPAFNEGALQPQARGALNPVNRWLLKQRGLTLAGPPAAELPLVVAWDTVAAWMVGNLNSYWASWAQAPARRARLLVDEGVQWAVLGVLRRYYSLCERQIASKLEAGRYGLAHLPQRWHPIVHEALRLREGKPGAYAGGRVARAPEAAALVTYVVEMGAKR